ncbi:cupin domain-containing protein [Candidatus Pacearchaeota archaeon]|nr:cupin domain-containing protein [Candidatus Pacearchaeota archaeon]
MDYTSIIKPPVSKVLKSGRVILKPEEEVGEHVTDKREEVIIILKGTATLVNEGNEFKVEAGETYFVPENKKHNVINKGTEKLEYIYVVSLFE